MIGEILLIAGTVEIINPGTLGSVARGTAEVLTNHLRALPIPEPLEPPIYPSSLQLGNSKQPAFELTACATCGAYRAGRCYTCNPLPVKTCDKCGEKYTLSQCFNTPCWKARQSPKAKRESDATPNVRRKVRVSTSRRSRRTRYATPVQPAAPSPVEADPGTLAREFAAQYRREHPDALPKEITKAFKRELMATPDIPKRSPGRPATHDYSEAIIIKIRADWDAEYIKRGGAFDARGKRLDKIRVSDEWWEKVFDRRSDHFEGLGWEGMRRLVQRTQVKRT